MLLILSPIGFALYYINIYRVATFVINIAVIVPLIGILGFIVDQLAYYLREVFRGLLVTTFI
jgi:Ca2+/H+ antiporter